MHPSHPRRAFTLIELLVVIAIIAILAVVVVLVLNPAQLLAQSRDANRVSDMATLSSALNLYSTDQSGASGYTMGSSSVVYASLPDASSTSCTDLGLPAMPTGYAWGCTTPQALRNASSSGWVPVDLKAISSGSPLGSLPIDPVNSSSSRLFYTYTTNGTQYEVTAAMESTKYRLGGSGDVIAGDGSSLATVYAKGTNLALEPLDYGDPSLVGYWPMDEGSGGIAYDYSGSGATGTWSGAQIGTSGYYSPGYIGTWAGAFDGTTTKLISGQSVALGMAYTISAWVDPTVEPGQQPFFSNRAGGQIYFGTAGGSVFLYCNSCSPAAITGGTVPLSTWSMITAAISPSTITLYVNGVSEYSGTWVINSGGGTGTLMIGYDTIPNYWNGFIQGLRIYDRTLSSSEVAGLYHAQR